MTGRRRKSTSIKPPNAGSEGSIPVTSIAPPHWQEMARQWARLGSPLRPPAEDVCFYAKTVQCWAQRSERPPRTLILGVTVEIYHLPWPSGTRLLALDHTGGMIQAVWPGPSGTAICGDWQAIPLASNSQDIVFCDGGASVLAYPHQTRRMIASLESVLAPGGVCVLRLYAPPATRESPGDVLSDLLAGRIANLNLLKLRLAMAMQQDPREGVELGKIWQAVATAAPDFEALASRIGWSLDHLMAINAYRRSPVRYYFPSLTQVLKLFEESGAAFKVQEIHCPKYALGECCPTVVFRTN